MTYSQAKGQGQRSVGSKDREHTNGWLGEVVSITGRTNKVNQHRARLVP